MGGLRTVLVGLGGYGSHYVDAALDTSQEIGIELAGVVDPSPDRISRYPEIRDRCGDSHESLELFFATGSADLVVIAAPIQFHAPFSITALSHGATVLCEKPAAGSIQDAIRMAEAASAAAGELMIGFQWSFSTTVNEIRSRVATGEFGECRRVRVLGLWPRSAEYYQRNNWAGRQQASDGRWILDSPLNNALAHYVHNPLYVLGQHPHTVTAELYRVNPIETFDTVALQSTLSAGTELTFCASHAVPGQVNPVITYEFEHHTITGRHPGEFSIRHPDGSVERLASAKVSEAIKLGYAAAVARGERSAVSTIDQSLDQLRVVAGAHLSHHPVELPAADVRTTGSLRWGEGVAEALALSFATGRLPSELDTADWATRGAEIDVSHLDTFDGPAVDSRSHSAG